MARQTRPVHIQALTRGDYIDVKGFGDCKVLKADDRLSEDFGIARIWAVSPHSQIVNVCLPCDAMVNLVVLVVDDNPDVEESTQTVLPVALRRGDTFYFGRSRVTSLTSGIKHPGEVHFVTKSGEEHRLRVSPTIRLRRVVTTRKAKPLSFTEFALSSYERVLGRLAKAVMRLQMEPARVEIQKPAKKAENALIITTKDVPSSAPVASETEPPIRYCVEPTEPHITVKEMNHSNIQTGHYDDHVLTCTDLIDELLLARIHHGDSPVSIVNPENGFKQVNVSGTMVENLYQRDETYWGARTWDTQPGSDDAKPESVLSLW